MTTTPDTETQPERADLAAFIAGHLNGRTAEALSAEFHDLLEAVRAHGKKGELRITVVVEPPANGVDSAPLPIGVESAVKAPKPTPVKSLYFLDDDGNPVREDPRQMALNFRDTPANDTFKDAH